MPMFIQGLAGINRRLYDGGMQYAHAQPWLYLNVVMSMAAWTLALFQIPFIINFFMSIRNGKKVSDNPWGATTLEWSAPSPPPHGNFVTVPEAYRGPYEYSVPGHPGRLRAPGSARSASRAGSRPGRIEGHAAWKFRTPLHRVLTPGCTTPSSGSGCSSRPRSCSSARSFSSYILLRVNAVEWPLGSTILNVPIATVNTIVLIGSSVTMVMAWASLKLNDFPKYKLYMGLTILAAADLPVHQGLRVATRSSRTTCLPSTSTFSRSTSR